MRISDWSSDVCSSDLVPLHSVTLERRARSSSSARASPAGGCRGPWRQIWPPGSGLSSTIPTETPLLAATCAADRPAGERKSVAEGKGVSVRVDLGGRRSLKKKKQSDNTNSDIT